MSISKLAKISIFIAIVIVIFLAIILVTYVKLQSNTQKPQIMPESPAILPAGSINENQKKSTENKLIENEAKPFEAPPIPGEKTDDQNILEKYGKYAFETFDKYPALVRQIRTTDPSFHPEQMDTSFPSNAYRLKNGKDYLALGGCTPHNCGGTAVIVLCNVTEKLVYVGRENIEQSGLDFIGNPNQDEKDTMLNFYLQK